MTICFFSLITVHPFTTSRESTQSFWSIPAQKRRQAPDAQLTELFISLHCMLFTNIQLDDFKGVLSRLEEKLLIEGGLLSDLRYKNTIPPLPLLAFMRLPTGWITWQDGLDFRGCVFTQFLSDTSPFYQVFLQRNRFSRSSSVSGHLWYTRLKTTISTFYFCRRLHRRA